MNTLSAEQQRLLQGMGYTLLRRADAPRAPSQVAEPEPVFQPAGSGAATAAPAQPSAAPHPLWSQILLALNAPPERAGLFLADSGPALQFEGDRLGLNLDALRRDPVAKRRLWQTLRALRPAPG